VLPDFEDATGNLPGGRHDATLDEVRTRFGYNFRRREIIAGLEDVLHALKTHGVVDIWLDGSFVTSKMRPSDVDVVYSPVAGDDPSNWPDTELVSPDRKRHLKKYYRVDLWPYPSHQPSGKTILEFFETDRNGKSKGIVHLIEGGSEDDPQRASVEGSEEETA
jgi:hypothetical protein